MVDRAKIIDGRTIQAGDVVLGLPSAGLHTNGYSLARKLFFEKLHYKSQTFIDELNQTVGDALLQTHLSYLKEIGPLLDAEKIKGLAHITGGGLLENIPRILPEGTAVEIKRGSWPVLPIFELMRRLGNIAENEMFRVFNMGIGMVVICAAANAPALVARQPAARGGALPHRRLSAALLRRLAHGGLAEPGDPLGGAVLDRLGAAPGTDDRVSIGAIVGADGAAGRAARRHARPPGRGEQARDLRSDRGRAAARPPAGRVHGRRRAGLAGAEPRRAGGRAG